MNNPLDLFAWKVRSERKRQHQTQKPLALMRELVKICVPGGRVLDPFAGSGTTLLAAREQGLDAVGIEAVPEIYRAAKARLGL